MNDKTLVEQQFAALKKAHKDVVEKYCDLVLEKNQKTDTIEALQSRIETLEAALRDIKNAVRIGPVTDIVAWQRLGIACQAIATKALEGE